MALATQPIFASIPEREGASAAEMARMAVARGSAKAKKEKAMSRATEPRQLSAAVKEGARASRTPLRTTAAGGTVLGYLNYSYWDQEYGLYELTPTDYELLWEDPFYLKNDCKMYSGWLRGGRICGFSPETTFMGDMVGLWYVEADAATGTTLVSRRLDTDKGYFTLAAYNPEDDHIWGFGFDREDKFGFMKASAATPQEATMIKEVGEETPELYCSSFAYNPDDKCFYGVNTDYNFVRIADNGDVTVLAPVNMSLGGYNTGMVWSPLDRLFYWNAVMNDDSSMIMTIDPAKLSVETLMEFSNDETFNFLMTPDEIADASRPMRPEVGEPSFPAGALSGSVAVTPKAESETGSQLPGELRVRSWVDGKEYDTVRAYAGSARNIEFADLSEGEHQFAFATVYNEVESRKAFTYAYVGADTPVAPANVKLTSEAVTWSRVTEGVHGGWINMDAIQYEVRINGETVGTTTSERMDVALPTDTPQELYTAEVYAIVGDKISDAGRSEAIVAGRPYEVPVSIRPTSKEFKLMTTADSNEDGNTWSYNADAECLDSGYSEYGKMDDWIFLPATEFESGEFYSFSMRSRVGDMQWPNEKLEVRIGTAAAPYAQRKVIAEAFTPGDSFTETSYEFQVEESGVYYVGLHCVSDYDQYGVWVQDIKIENSHFTGDAPASVTEAKATAAPEGRLEAKVEFTLPTARLDGTPFDSDAELKAMVTCVETVESTGKPGEKVEVAVATQQGDNKVRIAVSDGEKIGPQITVNVYTGIEVPAPVSNVRMDVRADMMAVTMEWDSPATGENGGYIDPDGVYYTVYLGEEDMFGGIEWTPLEDVEPTEYTYLVEPGTPQTTLILGVTAANEIGVNKYMNGGTALVGTPYSLPMDEDFDDPENPINYNPWRPLTPSKEYTGNFSLYYVRSLFEDWKDEPGIALVGTCRQAGGRALIAMPRFTSVGAHDTYLTMRVWTGSFYAPITVLGECFGMEAPVVLKEIEGGHGWADVTFTLPSELQQQKWVQIYFDAYFPVADQMAIIDSVTVANDGASTTEVRESGTIVRGTEGAIEISCAGKCDITVWSADGRLVRKVCGDDDVRIRVERGVYVVKAGDTLVKTVVK